MQDETSGERAIQPMSELAPAIAEALAVRDAGRVRSLVVGMQAPDLADLIELLEPPERVGFVESLGPAFDPEALSELEEGVRDQLLRDLPHATVAKAVAELETDDAAYVLESLDEEARQAILAQIPTVDRAALERNLE